MALEMWVVYIDHANPETRDMVPRADLRQHKAERDTFTAPASPC